MGKLHSVTLMKIVYLLVLLVLLVFQEDSPARSLQEILNSGEIRVGVKEDSFPFGFRDRDGSLKGFEVDIAKYIADYISLRYKTKLKVKLLPVSTKNRLEFLKQDKVDFVIATITATRERDLVVDFSIFYFILHICDVFLCLTTPLVAAKSITN